MTFRHLTTETLFDLCSKLFLTMLSSIFHRAVQCRLDSWRIYQLCSRNWALHQMYEIKLLTLLLQNKSNHTNDKVDFVVSHIDKEAAISGLKLGQTLSIKWIWPGKTNLKQTELILSDSLFTSSSVWWLRLDYQLNKQKKYLDVSFSCRRLRQNICRNLP